MKKYISTDPEIMGGTPVIIGTRVPIEVILYRLKEGYTIAEISKLYPWVGKHKFEKVLEELAQRVSKSWDDEKILQAQTSP
jgi:uncharacterized protein (DUF433 family)